MLLGLWAMLTGAEQAPALGTAVRVAGWAALAGGQFVFMVLVADHFFPRASRLEFGFFFTPGASAPRAA